MKRALAVSILFLVVLSSGCQDAVPNEFPILEGPYLGQTPPGDTPEIFAPGIVSTGFDEHIAYFSPDGNEFFFRLLDAPHSVALVMKQVDGRWAKPQILPFTEHYGAKFSLSPDGNTIVFNSNRPLSERGEPTTHHNLWAVRRAETGWGEPELLLEADGGCPSISNQGNLYFYADTLGGFGEGDLFVSRLEDGVYQDPENLGEHINTPFYENDPFIAPDESYLLFSSTKTSRQDLYISYRQADGSWTPAINLGETINAVAMVCASVTPDGKYLFFSSDAGRYKGYSETPLSYVEKLEILSGPGAGSEDIYWVSAKVIDELKPKDLK
jgi:Tol biopolymer transport system component